MVVEIFGVSWKQFRKIVMVCWEDNLIRASYTPCAWPVCKWEKIPFPSFNSCMMTLVPIYLVQEQGNRVQAEEITLKFSNSLHCIQCLRCIYIYIETPVPRWWFVFCGHHLLSPSTALSWVRGIFRPGVCLCWIFTVLSSLLENTALKMMKPWTPAQTWSVMYILAGRNVWRTDINFPKFLLH